MVAALMHAEDWKEKDVALFATMRMRQKTLRVST
jgi:hypothetical protein